MAALLRHLSQDLVDGKLAGSKAVFFLLYLFSPLFLRVKTSLPFLHMQKERQKHHCFVKIPFLLHIQLLVMSALFLNCLLALHADNSALLVV